MFGEKKRLVMCQACRALVDPAEKACPMCGNETVPEQRISTSGEAGNFFSMLIIGINVLIFILMGVVGMKSGRGMESFIASASNAVLNEFGSFSIYFVNQGEWWRFVTANFLHIGLIHLLFNSYALYQIGPIVEEIYGEQKFIFVYIVTGILCGVPSYFFGINGAGASGAISGLIGLMAVYGYRLGGTFGKALMKSMLTWMAMTVVYGFVIGANNAAHVGGFLAGAALSFLLKGEPVGTVRAKTIWNGLALISILIFAVSFAMVGKNFGAVQELMDKQQETSRQSENVIRLSDAVGDAEEAVRDSNNLSSQSNLNDIAKNLKRKATDILNIGQIDERSDEIRNRLMALLNKRADRLDKAAKNPTESTAISIEERSQYEAVFKDYKEWQDSVLEKYGLIYTDKK